jgi:hypothetical protein
MTGLELGIAGLNAPGMARFVWKGNCTMSLSLRPVVEKWGPSCGFLLGHEEMVDLLRQIAALAGIDSHCQHEYGDLEVVWIHEGQKFLDLLRGGRQALLEAKEHTVDASDMTDEEIECVEQMAGMVDQWQEMIGDDGSLRIYVD